MGFVFVAKARLWVHLNVADSQEGDCDGYTTAVENMESEEDDQSRDVVGQAAPSSSGNSGQPVRFSFLKMWLRMR